MLAVKLTDQQFTDLVTSQTQMITSLDRIWVAIVAGVFLGFIFLLCMILAAAWSVHVINKRQGDLEGKFTILIDVLLRQVRADIEANKVDVHTHSVEITGG